MEELTNTGLDFRTTPPSPSQREEGLNFKGHLCVQPLMSQNLKVIPNYGVQILKITQMCHPNEQSKIDV
jgi:hypothetical protein